MRGVHWINALSRRDLLALSGRADRLSADVASRALCSLLGGGVPSEAETSQAAAYLTPLKRPPPSPSSSPPALAELRHILATLTKTQTQPNEAVAQFLREAKATVAAPPLPPVVVAARVDSGLARQRQQARAVLRAVHRGGGREMKLAAERPAAAVAGPSAAAARALLQPGDADEALAGLTPAQCVWVAEFARSEAAEEEEGKQGKTPSSQRQPVLRGRSLRARVLRPLVKRLAVLYAAEGGGGGGGGTLPLSESLLRFAFEEGRVSEPALLSAYLASGEEEGEAAAVPSVAALDTLVRVYGSESATAPFGRTPGFFPRSLLLEKAHAVLEAAGGGNGGDTTADAVVSVVAALGKLCTDALVMHSVDRRLAAASGDEGEGKMPAEAAAYARCVDAACALALQAVGELPQAAVPPVLVRLSALAHLCSDAEGLWGGSCGGSSEAARLRHRATLHKLALRTLHRSLERGAVDGLGHASVALCCLAGGGSGEMLEETLAAYIATQRAPLRVPTPLLAYAMQLLPRRSQVLEHYVSSLVRRQGDVSAVHPRALVALGPRLSGLLMSHVAVPPRGLWLADGAWASLLTLHLADPETAILPMLMHEVTQGL